MKKFDVTFEITVSVQAESEENIDFDEAATEAIFTMQNEGASQFVKEVREFGKTLKIIQTIKSTQYASIDKT